MKKNGIIYGSFTELQHAQTIAEKLGWHQLM